MYRTGCPTLMGVGKNAQGCGVKSPGGGGGVKSPGKNIKWAKRGKRPMWGKKPIMGRAFCLFFGGHNDVIPCNIFVTHFAKPVYLSLKPMRCIPCSLHICVFLFKWNLRKLRN